MKNGDLNFINTITLDCPTCQRHIAPRVFRLFGKGEFYGKCEECGLLFIKGIFGMLNVFGGR